MKTYFKTLVAILILAPIFSFGQGRYSATFNDGTKIEFDVIEDHTDQMHKLNFVFAGYGNEVSAAQKELFATYFIPDVCFLKGGLAFDPTIGLTSVGAEGLYFLGSKEKEKQTSATLKSTYVGNNTTERKVAKFPIMRKTYFGLHGGLYQLNFGSRGEDLTKGTGTFSISDIKGTELILGGGLWRGTRLRWNIVGGKNGKRQGTTQFGLYADAQLFIGRNFVSKETTLNASGNNIVSGETVGKNDILAPFVYRIYMEGKTSIVGSKDFGLYYQLGVGKSPDLSRSSLSYILGLGIYLGF